MYIENGIDYPLKKLIRARGEPVELSFSVAAYFGTHDVDESGDSLQIIRSGKITCRELTGEMDQWNEILPGIEYIYQVSYGTNMRKSTESLRIQPNACPVLLCLRKFTCYSASDYPHHNRLNEKFFSILVVDRFISEEQFGSLLDRS